MLFVPKYKRNVWVLWHELKINFDTLKPTIHSARTLSLFEQTEQYCCGGKVFGHQWVAEGHCYKAHFDCLTRLTKSARLASSAHLYPSPPRRSLCPDSLSCPSKPDYCLSIQTQSLVLIRTNLLVFEHTSCVWKKILFTDHYVWVSILPFFCNLIHFTLLAEQPLSQSIELLNGHDQPATTTRQWILKIHQAANQQGKHYYFHMLLVSPLPSINAAVL